MELERVAPARHRGRRHDRKLREIAEQRRVRLLDEDLDGARVLRDHRVDVLQQGAPVATAIGSDEAGVLRIEQALEREHDRVGIERRAIVERDVIAQVERPGPPVRRDVPGLGELRLDIGGAGLPADQALVDQLADLDRLAVGHEHGVERDHIGGLGDDEDPGVALAV